jgi:hypothetical protein
LAVVAGLWLLSLFGALDIEADAAEGILDDVLEPLDLSEVPFTVLLTIFSLGGWFVSVLASIFLLDSRSGTALAAFSAIIGIVAAIAGIAITAWIAPTLGNIFTTATAPSKRDLIGRIAEIRSQTVTESTGRAEAPWPDGTVSTIDVRISSDVSLAAGELQRGDRAFIVDWLEDSDDFIVDRIPTELAE